LRCGDVGLHNKAHQRRQTCKANPPEMCQLVVVGTAGADARAGAGAVVVVDLVLDFICLDTYLQCAPSHAPQACVAMATLNASACRASACMIFSVLCAGIYKFWTITLNTGISPVGGAALHGGLNCDSTCIHTNVDAYSVR